ncbi:hypothetical protein E2C01_068417 [Portunus trituberculatus]|uniref:Uncharacterized protein n=1 Tax=Portunus trituberculatus TaxID=210409 RepID=A0A5B7HRX9_PORTR|nr:hypothetical protein [Portunus trituberculatus]
MRRAEEESGARRGGGRKRSMGQGRMEACGGGSRGLGGRARPICKHAIMIPLLQRNDSVVNFGLRISPPLCWGARGCSCHATWTPPGQLPSQPPAAEHPPVAASTTQAQHLFREGAGEHGDTSRVGGGDNERLMAGSDGRRRELMRGIIVSRRLVLIRAGYTWRLAGGERAGNEV